MSGTSGASSLIWESNLEKRWPEMIRSGSAATRASRLGSRCMPTSAMPSPLNAVMVEGMSFLGAATSSTSHCCSTSKVRLSREAARVTGKLISTAPSFASIVTDEAWVALAVSPEAAEGCEEGAAPEEQAARPRAAMAAMAAREVVVRDIISPS